MTVDHYAEAREQAIEVLTGHPVFDPFDSPEGDKYAKELLDLLIAAKLSTECPTCGGKGRQVALDDSRVRAGVGPVRTYFAPCPDCTDGRIEGCPLVILAPEAQVVALREALEKVIHASEDVAHEAVTKRDSAWIIAGVRHVASIARAALASGRGKEE